MLFFSNRHNPIRCITLNFIRSFFVFSNTTTVWHVILFYLCFVSAFVCHLQSYKIESRINLLTNPNTHTYKSFARLNCQFHSIQIGWIFLFNPFDNICGWLSKIDIYLWTKQRNVNKLVFVRLEKILTIIRKVFKRIRPTTREDETREKRHNHPKSKNKFS